MSGKFHKGKKSQKLSAPNKFKYLSSKSKSGRKSQSSQGKYHSKSYSLKKLGKTGMKYMMNAKSNKMNAKSSKSSSNSRTGFGKVKSIIFKSKEPDKGKMSLEEPPGSPSKEDARINSSVKPASSSSSLMQPLPPALMDSSQAPTTQIPQVPLNSMVVTPAVVSATPSPILQQTPSQVGMTGQPPALVPVAQVSSIQEQASTTAVVPVSSIQGEGVMTSAVVPVSTPCVPPSNSMMGQVSFCPVAAAPSYSVVPAIGQGSASANATKPIGPGSMKTDKEGWNYMYMWKQNCMNNAFPESPEEMYESFGAEQFSTKRPEQFAKKNKSLIMKKGKIQSTKSREKSTTKLMKKSMSKLMSKSISKFTNKSMTKLMGTSKSSKSMKKSHKWGAK